MIDLAYIFLELENAFFHIFINYYKTKNDPEKSMVEDDTPCLRAHFEGFWDALNEMGNELYYFFYFF